MAKMIAGKAVYGAVCLLAAVLLVVAGYAHKEVGFVKEFGKGVAISGKPASVGEMNILVMGLESRTDYEGHELDHHMQVVLHSGSRGGQATNTLMLIHVFAGGKKAVGFSISRDDLVTFPQPYDGFARGKIDAAYGWAYDQYLNQHAAEERDARFLDANKAGQAATVATVQSVTGQKVDHFVELNLVGFYYLAQAFGGIEVCLRPDPGNHGLNLTDRDPFAGTFNSGFDAYADGYNKAKGGAQYLHLNPAQSLAFVRSRDTLPGTDLGRTVRQQAAIDYVIWNLKHAGIYSDLGKLNSLLGTASKYLITDSTFNLLDFAPSMSTLKGENLGLTTLPYTPENGVVIPDSGYGNQPQDVNIIDVPRIQKIVKDAFDPQSAAKAKNPTGKANTAAPALPSSSVTVDVYNGNPAAAGLAGQMSRALAGLGYKAGTVGNASAQSQKVLPGTQVFYGAGASANAEQIAVQFGTKATALAALPADHVEVLIGSTVAAVPPGIAAARTATAGTQSTGAQVIGAQIVEARAAVGPAATPTASSTAGAGSGGTGDAVTVAPSARFGIPCVY
jgi:LCP family protein required for cell wall assembly